MKLSVQEMIFLAPVTAKYTEKNLKITKPLYNEQILSVPWPFILQIFHCFWSRIRLQNPAWWGGGGEDCHIWAIQIFAALRGMVFKQYQLSALKHTYQLHGMAVPYACAQPYHLGIGSHGQLFCPCWGSSARHSHRVNEWGLTCISKTVFCRGECKALL